MMAARIAQYSPDPRICGVSVKILRQWCSPEVILVVTNLADEFLILPHVIHRAKASHAKIVLAHVVAPVASESLRKPLCSHRPVSRLQHARTVLDRMARQLRWLGFTCQPLVLTGRPEVEIPLLAQSCCVDRVIVGFAEVDSAKDCAFTAPEQLFSNVNAPTCVIGNGVKPASSSWQPARRITLAVSSESECAVPLAFACRLAQELRAKLTVLHVFDVRATGAEPGSPRTQVAFASRLPRPTFREAELLCPTEVVTREGDPAEEILRHDTSTPQDLMILCSPGGLPTGADWRSSVSFKVLSGARCPIFVLRRQAGITNALNRGSQLSEKMSAYGETPVSSFRKEEFF